MDPMDANILDRMPRKTEGKKCLVCVCRFLFQTVLKPTTKISMKCVECTLNDSVLISKLLSGALKHISTAQPGVSN